MNMTIISIIITVFIIVLIVTLITLKKNRDRQQYNATLPKIIQLRSLITLLQKHRGMCASFLQGDQTSLTVIKTISSKIPHSIEQLDNSPIINQNARWLGFKDHWKRLKDNGITLSLEKSIEQHTDLVTNLLYLLEDIAEQQGLDKTAFEHIPHISLLWRELPFTAEYIGQSRILGTAIISAGLATPDDKVKLGDLETQISQLVKDVFQQIQSNGPVKPEQQQFIQLAIEACQTFTNIIRKELLSNREITIKPSDYFKVATRSIDAIHRLLDSELQGLSVFFKSRY